MLYLRRRSTAEPGLIAQSTEDHTRIVAAIIAQDPESAATAMARHLTNIKESTMRMMEVQKFDLIETRQKRPAR